MIGILIFTIYDLFSAVCGDMFDNFITPPVNYIVYSSLIALIIVSVLEYIISSKK